MGCIGLFCCFKDMRPNVIALVGLVANFIAFVFLIWALADLPWFRNGQSSLYYIIYTDYTVFNWFYSNFNIFEFESWTKLYDL